MKMTKYFLFSLICMICSCVVFAKDEVVIKSITPIYDETSTVVVTEEENNHSVVFNDKDQSVKYNVVIENTTDKDLTIDDIKLTNPSQDFLIYELEGLKIKDVLAANDTKEVIASLSTIKKEGWGRNFNDELTANISFTDSVLNPNTNTMGIVIILVIITFFTTILITLVRSKKISRYAVLVIMFSSLISVTKAKDPILLPIKLNVSFESQNVMQANGCESDDWLVCSSDFWDDYNLQNVKNFYIENELSEINDYIEKHDVSAAQDGRIIAYIVENKDDPDLEDVHLQADGIIYANEDASYYFTDMFNLEKIHNLEGFDTSKVTDMSYMFYRTGFSSENLTLDLSSFDTSNVTNMSGMFAVTGRNSTNFTLDLSNFDTSNVTDMYCMFENTGYNSENFTLDISNFNTSNVTNMGRMFFETGYNSTNFTLDVSNFDTSNVTNMWMMFRGTGYNSTNLNTTITIRNPNVTNYSNMFYDVATKTGSQITVNYTSETSDAVDKLIATKSSNSNVVKGVQVD